MMIVSGSQVGNRALVSWRRDMLAWLLSAQVVGADGVVYSWHNPQDPGYAYPEIGGYLLDLLAQEGASTEELRNRIAGWLTSILDECGGVGRDGLLYLFDTAIVVGGLLSHYQAGGRVERRVLDRAYRFVADLVLARGAARDGAGAIVLCERWSLSYGCHLLKVMRSLQAYHRLTGRAEALLRMEQLLADLCTLYQDGRFSVSATTSAVQLHAHCYALEGLLAYAQHAPPLRLYLRSLLSGGAAWLADVQRNDGSFPEWSDGRIGWGKSRADVAAQAVRLWSAIDSVRYRSARERALGFLRRLQAPGRGICFEPGSACINTWTTIFAVQALDWLEAPRPEEII